MSWEVRTLEDPPVIETVYAGRMTPQELEHAVVETLAAAKRAGCLRLLGDCTALEGGHSIADLYFLAELVQKAGFTDVLVREAILLPALPEAADNVRFWESTASNRGLHVGLFDDREKALAWLLA